MKKRAVNQRGANLPHVHFWSSANVEVKRITKNKNK